MPTDAFLTIAEIAVTLAGFTGIILIFRSNRGSGFEENIRVFNVFVTCFLIIVTALLPGTLNEFNLSDELVWGIPYVLIGLCSIGLSLYTALSSRRGLFKPIFPKITVFFAVFWPVWGFGLLLYGIGIFGAPGAALLLLTHILLLAFAGYLFGSTLIWARSTDT